MTQGILFVKHFVDSVLNGKQSWYHTRRWIRTCRRPGNKDNPFFHWVFCHPLCQAPLLCFITATTFSQEHQPHSNKHQHKCLHDY